MKRFLRSLMVLACGGLVLAACTAVHWRDKVLKGDLGYVYVGIYEPQEKGFLVERTPMASEIRFRNLSPNAALFKDAIVLVDPGPLRTPSGPLETLEGQKVYPGSYTLIAVDIDAIGVPSHSYLFRTKSTAATFTVRNGEALYLGMYELKRVYQPASGTKCTTLLINRTDFAAFKKALAKREPKIAAILQYRPLAGPAVVEPQ